jgi:hypothetical protein
LQLIPLNYISPYSATNPFGTTTTINVNSGIITSTAPASAGRYVVCVTVEEWRNGVLINEHRKDVILAVENCSTVKPDAGQMIELAMALILLSKTNLLTLQLLGTIGALVMVELLYNQHLHMYIQILADMW